MSSTATLSKLTSLAPLCRVFKESIVRDLVYNFWKSVRFVCNSFCCFLAVFSPRRRIFRKTHLLFVTAISKLISWNNFVTDGCFQVISTKSSASVSSGSTGWDLRRNHTASRPVRSLAEMPRLCSDNFLSSAHSETRICSFSMLTKKCCCCTCAALTSSSAKSSKL